MSQPDLYGLFGCDRPGARLPRSHDNASLITMLYLKLGAALFIDENGRRVTTRPCRGLFCTEGSDIPQLPDPRPSEAFQTPEQWEGALKLVDYLFHRMDRDDVDFAFDAFAAAQTAVDVAEARRVFHGEPEPKPD